MENKMITIGHLFPELLNVYSDRGNILTLKNRLMWRGISADVKIFRKEDEIDFSSLDIVLLGGGSERDQLAACKRLMKAQDHLKEYVESGGVLLALCDGYPLLGHYYEVADERIDGLSLIDMYTEHDEKRLIGDVVADAVIDGEAMTIVGFENHSGRTYIGNSSPLGKICCGFGDNGKDGICGVQYKNIFGTYLHGPLLPKNPKLTDAIIKRALSRKYGEEVCLAPLDDTLEQTAHDYVVKRFTK